MKGASLFALLLSTAAGCAGLQISLKMETDGKAREDPQEVGLCQTLHTGDPFSLVVEADGPTYVYALREGSGGPQVLFPAGEWSAVARQGAGTLHLPRAVPWFTLDEGGGFESITAVVTRAPLSRTQVLREVQARRAEPPEETCREVPVRGGERDREAPVRGGERDRDVPVRGGERERGLVAQGVLGRSGVAVLRIPFRHAVPSEQAAR